MDNPLAPHPGSLYAICVQGHLTEGWSEWFGGLTIQAEDDSTTTLRGWLPDQSALLGVLNQIHALNLSLVSVTCVSKLPPGQTAPTAHRRQAG